VAHSADADTGPMRRRLIALALLVAACGGGNGAAGSTPRNAPTGEPPASSRSSVASSPAATVALPSVQLVDGNYLYGGQDVDHPAGTYAAPYFAYPFTAAIDRDLGIRDSGQTATFVYIGQDKNAPINGDEEFDVMFLSRVLDPDDQRSLGSFSGDAFEWFVGHARLALVEGSSIELKVDGLDAQQADFLPSRAVPCGNFHRNLQCVLIGYGPDGAEPFALFDGSRMRIVVIEHADRQIVFTYQSADTTEYADKVAVFDGWVRSVDFT
jgi:hypothetical protein